MKKILSLLLLSVFLTSNSAQLASANTVDSNENFILNENLNTMEMVHEHIGTCDCNTTYEQHDKTLKTLLETNNITTKALACDCGGALNKKVLSTGEWYYSSYSNCTHGKSGVDYIYKRRIITRYKCSSCSFYKEVDTYETDRRCQGV